MGRREAGKHERLQGGNPPGYWALPFDERCRHHAPEGVTVRDVSKAGLQDAPSSPRLRDKVRSHHVTERGTPEGTRERPARRCESCGHPLRGRVTGRRRFCDATCRKRASRGKKAGAG